MISADASFDQQRLRFLASAIMDGTASETQQSELTALLRDNAAARDEYLEFVDLHAILASELLRSTGAEEANAIRGKRSWPRRNWILFASGVVAAGLLLAFGLLRPGQNAGPSKGFFSSIVQLTDAEWDSGAELKVGHRLGRETLRLRSGFVRLEFDSGVEVTLQGPAEFQLVADDKTRLLSGLLTATVPPGAERFTVDTPSAEIVDLGTSFGVDLRENGVSSVSVFDGQVEVGVPNADEKRLLNEGQSVRIGAERKIEDAEFQPERFAKVWPISSGIVGSSDAFRFVPPWPKRIRFVRSDEKIFVASEGYPVTLRSPLQVNVSQPGKYVRETDLNHSDLPAGERVRSYILHFSPTENLSPRRAKRVSGSITFDRPVLGLIVRHEELSASRRRFSRRNAGEEHHRRQLDLTGGSNGDRVTLSDDRKTVVLDLISPRRNTDLVRVIVAGDNYGGISTEKN